MLYLIYIEGMMKVEGMTAAEIAEAVHGKLLAGNPETVIKHICIDSREAGEGSLFVPIIGEKVDAHKFIAQVLDQGRPASLCLMEMWQNRIKYIFR